MTCVCIEKCMLFSRDTRQPGFRLAFFFFFFFFFFLIQLWYFMGPVFLSTWQRSNEKEKWKTHLLHLSHQWSVVACICRHRERERESEVKYVCLYFSDSYLIHLTFLPSILLVSECNCLSSALCKWLVWFVDQSVSSACMMQFFFLHLSTSFFFLKLARLQLHLTFVTWINDTAVHLISSSFSSSCCLGRRASPEYSCTFVLYFILTTLHLSLPVAVVSFALVYLFLTDVDTNLSSSVQLLPPPPPPPPASSARAPVTAISGNMRWINEPPV